MISFLSGIPKIYGNELIMVVNGVGYGVKVGSAVFQQANTTEALELFIYTHVREDDISLFGFATIQEKQMFLQLLNVSGVGPQTALAISNQGASAIIHAIQQADVTFFSAVPRVGKKLAQKIIIELKGKIGSVKELDLTPESQQQQDVADALRSLGFAEQEIQKALQVINVNELSLQEAVTQCIKLIGNK